MSIRRTHENRTGYFFFTFTCYNWLHLFSLTKLYDNIYEWFDKLQQQTVYINAYVIMPNHIHAVIYAERIQKDINDIIGTGKRFFAYEIIDRLKDMKNGEILRQLSAGVSDYERLKGQKHKVFETSSDIKQIYSLKFVGQKINYIHANPVRGKWNLVSDYRLYELSSAGFYEPMPGAEYKGYEVVHYNDVESVVGRIW